MARYIFRGRKCGAASVGGTEWQDAPSVGGIGAASVGGTGAASVDGTE